MKLQNLEDGVQTRLYPFTRLSPPLRGGGICEVNMESGLHIFPKRRKQSSILRLLFKIKMDKVESEYRFRNCFSNWQNRKHNNYGEGISCNTHDSVTPD